MVPEPASQRGTTSLGDGGLLLPTRKRNWWGTVPTVVICRLSEPAGDSWRVLPTSASPAGMGPPSVAGSVQRGCLEGLPGVVVQLRVVGLRRRLRAGPVLLKLVLQAIGDGDEPRTRCCCRCQAWPSRLSSSSQVLDRISVNQSVGAEELANDAVAGVRPWAVLYSRCVASSWRCAVANSMASVNNSLRDASSSAAAAARSMFGMMGTRSIRNVAIRGPDCPTLAAATATASVTRLLRPVVVLDPVVSTSTRTQRLLTSLGML